jgi:hypothetical protein
VEASVPEEDELAVDLKQMSPEKTSLRSAKQEEIMQTPVSESMDFDTKDDAHREDVMLPSGDKSESLIDKQPEVEEEIIEIKNPVEFTMMHESEVKVNDTDSSRATNLVLKDRMAYDDDHTQNDQIISPSDGIYVQKANFYQP